MTRGSNGFVVVLVALVGLWGCARGPANATGQADRIRTLETKCARLEEDYRAVASARDQARKQLAAAEEQRGQLQKELVQHKAALKERDALRQQVETRTGERDALQTRCDRLKKGLQNLLGQDDAMATPSTGPLTSSAVTAGGNS
jgi:septal ring factor EnvC (AmiA/AmiB activator)